LLHTFGEKLCPEPVGLSYYTKLAPKELRGADEWACGYGGHQSGNLVAS